MKNRVDTLISLSKLEALLEIRTGILRNSYTNFSNAVNKIYEEKFILNNDEVLTLAFLLAAIPPPKRNEKISNYSVIFIHNSVCVSEWGYESSPIARALNLNESDFDKQILSILGDISKPLFSITTDPTILENWKKNYKTILKNTVLSKQMWSH